MLCGDGPFKDGPHILTVVANGTDQDPFVFDQIQYSPSGSVSLNESLVRVDTDSPSIQYSNLGWNLTNQWTNYALSGTNSSFTNVAWSTLTMKFCGS